MRAEHPLLTEKPYWTLDVPLGPVSFLGKPPHPVRLAAHIRQERFTERPAINPVGLPSGEREYLLLRPYISPAEPSPNGQDIRAAIGHGQAWYYPEVRTIVLWELRLHGSLEATPLGYDDALPTLWRGVETVLTTQFPDAQRLLTPSWELEHPRPTWQRFLTDLGYTPHPTDEQTFTKSV